MLLSWTAGTWEAAAARKGDNNIFVAGNLPARRRKTKSDDCSGMLPRGRCFLDDEPVFDSHPFSRTNSRGCARLCPGRIGPAAPVKTEHVEAELVSGETALVPGKAVTVALRLKMADGWHTYWQNPGDSGLPTTLTWKVPNGMGVGGIEWPAPHALPTGPLVNFGYEGEVLLPTELQVPKEAVTGTTATLAARADWLVCKEVCIPEGADLELALPVSERSDPYPQWGAAIRRTRDALPVPLQGWQSSARGEGRTVKLTLTPPAGAADAGTLQFFPQQEGRVEPSGKQVLTRDAAGNYLLALPVAIALAPDWKRVTGVVTASGGFAVGKHVAAALIDVPLVGAVVAGPKPGPAPRAGSTCRPAAPDRRRRVSFALAMVFAFLGGLLLNLMPCVFPVLSLKVLRLGRSGHVFARVLRLQGLAFAAGVVVTFVALAGLLLACARPENSWAGASSCSRRRW